MPASDMVSSTSLMLPLLAAHAPLTTDAVITVIGPVGPLICECVPPKIEAKQPRSVAPTRPANAPTELADGSSMPPNA